MCVCSEVCEIVQVVLWNWCVRCFLIFIIRNMVMLMIRVINQQCSGSVFVLNMFCISGIQIMISCISSRMLVISQMFLLCSRFMFREKLLLLWQLIMQIYCVVISICSSMVWINFGLWLCGVSQVLRIKVVIVIIDLMKVICYMVKLFIICWLVLCGGWFIMLCFVVLKVRLKESVVDVVMFIYRISIGVSGIMFFVSRVMMISNFCVRLVGMMKRMVFFRLLQI